MTPLKPKLKFKGAIPYGGEFRLDLRDKGFVGFGTNFEMLMNNIMAYRKANGMVIGLGLTEEVECEVCKAYPQECVESDVRVPVPRAISWQEAVQGTRVMVNHRLGGTQLVSREEAERRAQVCINCPWNYETQMQCGGICGELKEVVQAIIGGQGTQYDQRLKSCAVCHCWLSAAVWVPLEIQLGPVTAEQKEQFKLANEQWGCWKYIDPNTK